MNAKAVPRLERLPYESRRSRGAAVLPLLKLDNAAENGVLKPMKNCILALLAGWLFLSPSLFAADSAVKLTKDDKKIDVELNGKPFTSYYYNDGLGAIFVRPFFYPVLAADGTPVTDDQSQTKGDHPHHRSMWIAHGNVDGADHWAVNKGEKQPKQKHIAFTKVEGDTIEEQLEWEGTTPEPILKETRTFKFFTFADGSRGVDFTSVFTPLKDKVVFGDTKESGLCAVRVVKAIANTSTLTQSTGATDSRPSKTEPNTWGKKADWCDISGKIDDKPYGITIFDHPQNPRHPGNWHCRLYGLMSSNIFGLSEFEKGAPKGDFEILKDKPVTFRYLVVIHAGDAKSADLDAKYKDYSAGK